MRTSRTRVSDSSRRDHFKIRSTWTSWNLSSKNWLNLIVSLSQALSQRLKLHRKAIWESALSSGRRVYLRCTVGQACSTRATFPKRAKKSPSRSMVKMLCQSAVQFLTKLDCKLQRTLSESCLCSSSMMKAVLNMTLSGHQKASCSTLQASNR